MDIITILQILGIFTAVMFAAFVGILAIWGRVDNLRSNRQNETNQASADLILLLKTEVEAMKRKQETQELEIVQLRDEVNELRTINRELKLILADRDLAGNEARQNLAATVTITKEIHTLSKQNHGLLSSLIDLITPITSYLEERK